MPRQKFFRRKSEHSYTEIRRETGLAKSTIQNWLTHAGLTLSKEHLEIQARKRVENYVIATAASKVTRKRRKDQEIQSCIQKVKKYFNDPFFNYGLAIFESEGCKSTECRFSNSDFRLIRTFVKFIEKYFPLDRNKNMSFDLYIHETRKADLGKIKGFWSEKIGIPISKMRVYWKKNEIVGRRDNPDYVGQMLVGVHGEKIFGSKLLALSDIILRKYQRA